MRSGDALPVMQEDVQEGIQMQDLAGQTSDEVVEHDGNVSRVAKVRGCAGVVRILGSGMWELMRKVLVQVQSPSK